MQQPGEEYLRKSGATIGVLEEFLTFKLIQKFADFQNIYLGRLLVIFLIFQITLAFLGILSLICTLMATNENLPSNVVKQLVKELKNLDEIPPEGIKVGVSDDVFSTIYADIEGPAGTPYENGVFQMKLILSHDFPQSAPKGKMLLENYDEYARHARLYTSIHAVRPKPRFKTGAIWESITALNVDQTKASVTNVDLKSSAPAAPFQLPYLLNPSPSVANPDQSPPALSSTTGVGISGSATAPVA